LVKCAFRSSSEVIFGKNVWWGKVRFFEEEEMVGEGENEDLSKKGSMEGSVVF
jgi:hypothetical protein